ncbi:tetratricopeptide repeat protein [Paenibacillus agricola]|uniref:Tetratricopeptide repeat protein n=1 Tax=Paenibacillus agricola TaxID=2716264 RepID=A0ABX0J3L0_9BACL|nr:tetratricopeptide repeat protein [Paenibacillus agricola]NHN30884.1 tetratricopeptide repeat protein [Paenibacillus agricola]
MKALIKPLLLIIALIIVIIIAFNLHVLAGWGLILVLVGVMLFTSRSSIYALIGSRAFAKGEMQKALVWYKKAFTSKPCPDKHRIGYGYLLMRSGDPVQAEQVLGQLIKATKSRDTRVQAQCNLATAYWLQGKKSEGLILLEQVFEEYKNTLVYGNLGYFKILHGDLNEALAFNLEAYTYNEGDLTILDNLALNYHLLGQADEAQPLFEKLMLKTPKYAEPYYYYSQNLQQQGKREEAIEQINVALKKELSFVTPITRSQIEQEAEELNKEELNKVEKITLGKG